MQTAYLGLEETLKHKDCSKLIIHSDQGTHYTNPLYVNKLKELGVTRVCREKVIVWTMRRLRVFSDTLKMTWISNLAKHLMK